MPFFSVIIPLYNKEKFISNTLNSILIQTFTDFEVVVVDDGSTDKSAEMVLSFTDSRISYFHKENDGVSSARNFGITNASAEYIALIDADDYWYPDFLQNIYNSINRFPEQKIFSTAIEIETSRNIIPAQYSIQQTGLCEVVNYFDASSKYSVICTSAVVIHKSVFEKTGLFDEAMKSGEDTDLWIRIGLEYQVIFCWKILAKYVFDETSLSKELSHTSTKINFSKFAELEKTELKLKKFLDLNRFSLAIKSSIQNDRTAFNQFRQSIDIENLSMKKRILLDLSPFALKQLISLQHFLANIGLGSSVFR